METISVQLQKRIARPIHEVRAQFFDYDHHIRASVHRDIRFTVLDRQENVLRVRQETKLLGLPQRDEVIVTRTSDGNVAVEFATGMNRGGKLVAAFRPDGPHATIVDATASVPARGIKRLLKPLFRVALTQLGRKALEEDRYDLEVRGYRRPA